MMQGGMKVFAHLCLFSITFYAPMNCLGFCTQHPGKGALHFYNFGKLAVSVNEVELIMEILGEALSCGQFVLVSFTYLKHYS